MKKHEINQTITPAKRKLLLQQTQSLLYVTHPKRKPEFAENPYKTERVALNQLHNLLRYGQEFSQFATLRSELRRIQDMVGYHGNARQPHPLNVKILH